VREVASVCVLEKAFLKVARVRERERKLLEEMLLGGGR
jgi:hypothetical protein